MPRLLFTKTGDAVWMSHLDLMRLFQRAFKRAGLPLTHTQGYNPRPSVSIALPLSVGVESICELLDFDLEGEGVSYKEIASRLNACLVDGVRVLRAYPNGMKIKQLMYLQSTIQLEYDKGIPEGTMDELNALFARDTLPVEKKGKNGPTVQDLIPMIRKLDCSQLDGHTLCVRLIAACQNPSLNPNQLVAAINIYLPQFAPDFAKCSREEIFDQDLKVFR